MRAECPSCVYPGGVRHAAGGRLGPGPLQPADTGSSNLGTIGGLSAGSPRLASTSLCCWPCWPCSSNGRHSPVCQGPMAPSPQPGPGKARPRAIYSPAIFGEQDSAGAWWGRRAAPAPVGGASRLLLLRILHILLLLILLLLLLLLILLLHSLFSLYCYPGAKSWVGTRGAMLKATWLLTYTSGRICNFEQGLEVTAWQVWSQAQGFTDWKRSKDAGDQSVMILSRSPIFTSARAPIGRTHHVIERISWTYSASNP